MTASPIVATISPLSSPNDTNPRGTARYALTPLVTLLPFSLIGAIVSISALDFLGFGLPPLTPSLGELLSQSQQDSTAWWLVLFPALTLFTIMLLAVFIGEGLRDAFDPKPSARYK